MEQQQRSSGRLQPIITNSASDEILTNSFNHLSLGASASAPGSRTHSSPLDSPSRSSFRRPSRHDPPPQSPLQHAPAPRRTPSSSSLRDDRRASAASLQRKISVTSLRNAAHNNGMGGGVPGSPRPSLSRKSSYNMLNSSSSTARPTTPSIAGDMRPATPPPTAASIASDHFRKEIAFHQAADLQSKTVVIIQDSCYGHRYSRPRTSKAGLDLIVERPERLHACVLGLSTAYVRLSKRHEGGPFAPHPDLKLQSLPVPPFQICKTTRSVPLNSLAVTHVHGMKWMDELKQMCDAAEARLALNGKELVRPNSSSGKGETPPPKLHEGDLYLCPESLSALEGALGGVCDAVDYVFGPGTPCRAFVCIRPPGHHCSSSYPSGFCWLNNVHVGISHAAISQGLTHAAILDFDLHHGDGSQAIAWDQNTNAVAAGKNATQYKKTAIGYFSLHDINSYPCEDGDETKVRNASVCIDNAHGQSIWNVHLEPWKNMQEFWRLYNTKYAVLLDKTREFLRFHSQRLRDSPNGPAPKAAIFLSAGFDASEWEGAGMQRHKVNVPTDFYAKFTSDVVRLSLQEGLGVDGRVISVLEGGYSDRALTSGVLSHLAALADTQAAASIHLNDDQDSRLAAEMLHRLGLSDENGRTSSPKSEDMATFDTQWWSLPLLEELELQARPPPPAAAPRKPRERGPPTYFAPTQSSVAKVVVPVRDRRSSGYKYGMDDVFAPHPVPPVDWATAAVEMAKVLIPTDRQTLSYQHAELKVDASRNRASRLSATSVELQGKMQLRERKPKTPPIPEDAPRPKASRSVPRHARRTTIASVSEFPDPSALDNSDHSMDTNAPAPPLRRLSIESSSTSVVSVPKSSSTAQRKPRGAEATPRSTKGNATPSRPVAADKRSKPALSSRPPTTHRSSPRKASATPGGARKTSPRETQPSQASTDENGELDKLTQGVKKLSIKLRMPTPEQHAAKIKAAEEQMKNASRSSSRKAQASSLPVSKNSSPKRKSPGPASSPPVAPSETSNLDAESMGESALIEATPTAVFSIPSLGSVPTEQSESKIESKESTAMPSPPPTPESSQSPKQSSPTDGEPNRPPRRSLPVFTSTSVIPFAASSPMPGSSTEGN